MAEVIFLPAVDADYRQALAWYQGRSNQAAIGFEAAVEVALRAIEKSPATWTLCADRHRFDLLRRFSYTIYYRLEPDQILIIAIAHTSRPDAEWRSRNEPQKQLSETVRSLDRVATWQILADVRHVLVAATSVAPLARDCAVTLIARGWMRRQSCDSINIIMVLGSWLQHWSKLD